MPLSSIPVVPPRRALGLAATLAAALAVSACSDISSTFPGLSTPSTPATPASADVPVTGDTIGAGPTRIALILPLSSANGQVPARSMRNAAEMALAEFNSTDLTIMVKDDKGTPEGAQAAAREALSQGAEAIIGPLFAPTVSAAASVARGANRPVVAFSTDATVAARGVYLLSFMPQTDVRRIVSYAAGRGKKSFAALIPNSAYGNVAEQEFANAVSAAGGRVVAVQRYDGNPASASAAVGRIKSALAQADSLFIPDDGNGLPLVAQALAQAGVSNRDVQMLGTGVWNEQRVLKTATVAGGWFAAPEGDGFQNFSQRYRQRFNADPTRIATLAYDATALAAAMVRMQGSQRWSETVMTNASGFSGQDGVFRFRADGTNERGLAIYQVSNGGANLVQAAPKSF